MISTDRACATPAPLPARSPRATSPAVCWSAGALQVGAGLRTGPPMLPAAGGACGGRCVRRQGGSSCGGCSTAAPCFSFWQRARVPCTAPHSSNAAIVQGRGPWQRPLAPMASCPGRSRSCNEQRRRACRSPAPAPPPGSATRMASCPGAPASSLPSSTVRPQPRPEAAAGHRRGVHGGASSACSTAASGGRAVVAGANGCCHSSHLTVSRAPIGRGRGG